VLIRGMTSRLAKIIAATSIVCVLAFAPAAVAQNSSVETYSGKGGEATGVANNDPTDPGSPSGTSSSDGGGALPFTGLDVGFLIGGGLLLIAVGAALARLRPHGEVG